MLNYDDIWKNHICTKVILLNDEYFLDHRKEEICTRKVVMFSDHFKPNQNSVQEEKKTLQSLNKIGELCEEWNMERYNIFTDGSWRDCSSNIEKMFYKQSQSKSSCSVCLIRTEDNWKDKPMILLEIENSPEKPVTCAFPMELLAASIALKITKRLTQLPLSTLIVSQLSR